MNIDWQYEVNDLTLVEKMFVYRYILRTKMMRGVHALADMVRLDALELWMDAIGALPFRKAA